MYCRRLPLQRLYNCRDLGGYPTRDGGRTRFGVFLRSEAPCGLPPCDVQALLDYGVHTSVDLRNEEEILARPSDLCGKTRYLRCEVIHRKGEGEDDLSRDFDWGAEYCRMAGYNAEFFRTVLPVAAQTPGVFHYHCTTGKDRTGLLSCVLLSIAGVSREDIAADYCLSQTYLAPVYARMREGSLALSANADDNLLRLPGGVERFFKTPDTAMLRLVDHLTMQWGSVESFILHCGVEQETLERIRAKFVVAPERVHAEAADR